MFISAIFLALAVLVIVLQATFTSAVFNACFSIGEHINFCNPNTPDRTAPYTGYTICMSSYNSSGNCYNQGSINGCNNLPGASSQQCQSQGNTTIDQEPPIINIISPIEGTINKQKSLVMNITLNEKADIFYINYNDRSPRWIRLCKSCLNYGRPRSFSEGNNNITIKAVDVIGNTAEKNLGFFVDTKKPRINKLEPRSGFVSGLFSLQFSELNPRNITLKYGNNLTGWRIQLVSLDSCILDSTKYNCETLVNLEDYNNQEIDYLFNVSDIAMQSEEKKVKKLKVDTSDPIINSVVYSPVGTRIEFVLNITEVNFDEALYIDNSASNSRWITLCSSLKAGICKKSLTLKPGNHSIDIQVFDDAGNSVATHLDINI